MSAEVAEAGYFLVTQLFIQNEIEQLKSRLEESGIARTRAGIRHAMSDPFIDAIAKDPRMMEIAQTVLGADAFPFRATIFDKSLTSNWLVVWHQDTALPLSQKLEASGWGPWSMKSGVHYAHAPARALELVLAIRLHLDDSHHQNGPLRVLPGTHHIGVLRDDEISRLTKEIEPVDCLVPAGGVLLMKPLLVHSSSKATNSSPRRVLHIEYSAVKTFPDGLELAIAGRQNS